MLFENLGHESWLLHNKNTYALVDPLLNLEFGANADYQYVKTSHSELQQNILSKIKLVILTTDHFQHYHLQSLKKLEKRINIYVSEFFANEKIQELKQEGFCPIICKYGELIKFEDLEFVFIPADEETYIWDSRVCSLIIASSCLENKSWIFIQSDTSINKNIKEWIPKNWFKKPSYVILVCHYKEYEAYGHSAWDNYISHPIKINNSHEAINFLSRLFPTEIYPLNIASNYILSGGEYELKRNARPKATFNNFNIVKLMEELLVNSNVFSTELGTVCSTFSNDKVSSSKYTKFHDNNRENIPIQESFYVSKVAHNFSSKEDFFIDHGIKYVGKALLFSKLGEKLLFTNNFMNESLDSKRFFLQLRNGLKHNSYTFCFSKNIFIENDSSAIDLIKFPAGIILNKLAFLDIISGRVSATEALTNNILQWYVGTIEESPLALFYTAFSKFVYPR
jgi:hypothetical protein